MQNRLLINTDTIQCCMVLFSTLVLQLGTEWLQRILLQAIVFQSSPMGKGMFVTGNLYKWEMCTSLEFKRVWVLLHFCLAFCHRDTNTSTHTMEHFQRSRPFYSPNSDCEMTQYFNQLYLICTPAEDRATCVLLLPWLAPSMPTGCLCAALDCRLPVSVAHSAHPSPIHPPLASLQWKYQVIGCWALVNSIGN